MDTQEEVRHRMPVPRFLHLDDPKTRRNSSGHVIVCYEGSKEAPTDYIFVGPPTPDMEPLDDEAMELSKSELSRGQHPMDSLSPNGYQGDILERFTKAIEAIGGIQPQNQSIANVSAEDFAVLQEQVQALIEQNAQLQAQLLGEQPVEA